MAQQKVVLKVQMMTDQKTKKKALEVIAGTCGITSISVDLKEQKITVVGEMAPIDVVKRLRKIGHADIMTVGSAK